MSLDLFLSVVLGKETEACRQADRWDVVAQGRTLRLLKLRVLMREAGFLPYFLI